MAVDSGVLIAAGSLVISAFGAGIAGLRGRGQARITDDARLRDDQRELINVLRADNSDVRDRLNVAEQTIRKQDTLIRQLQGRLDGQEEELTRIKRQQERGPR